MNPILRVVVCGLASLVGLALVIGARRLSLRYNGWTTEVRTRSAKRKPPSAEARASNTRIMTWLLRIFGVWMLLLSSFLLLLSIAVLIASRHAG